tara:strand:+ start:351 stop:689 length:339 start_codon:yes stop_codon:yes gene_type:complete
MHITDEIWSVLKPAAEIGDFATRQDIEDGIEKGQFMLWTKNKSAIVTSKIKNTIRIGLGGGNLGDIKLLVKDVEAYAKSHWMSHIDILGREGWERALDGYDRQAVLLRKKVI